MNREELIELLEIANNSMKSIDVKGKNYCEVNERVKAFRQVYPEGSIETELVSNENGVCVIKALVRNDEGKVLSTGYAYEKENSTFINKTSYIENCETSAVGRALGFMGIGVDTSIASAEEVKNAIANQDEDKNITSKTWTRLNKIFSKEQIKEFYKELGITKGSDLKEKWALNKIDEWFKDNNTMGAEEGKQFY